MNLSLFYREQAAQQERAADGATLQNVRNRARQAASAWAILAARSEQADGARAKIVAEKLVREPSENPDRGSASA